MKRGAEIGLQKKRGRPPGRTVGRAIAVRLPNDIEARLDAWVSTQPDKPSQSEAIRRLVERGLPKLPRVLGPPGLKRRKNLDGSTAFYWEAAKISRHARRLGYPLKTVRLHHATPAARAKRCVELTAELREWLAARSR